MNEVGLVIAAGIINWLVTTIFVESTLFAPWRNWVTQKSMRVCFDNGYCGPLGVEISSSDVPIEIAQSAHIEHGGPWLKLAQLVTCHMCLGTWVAFAEAIYFGGPLGGRFAIVANALLYKGVGHLVLELRPQAWFNAQVSDNEPDIQIINKTEDAT